MLNDEYIYDGRARVKLDDIQIQTKKVIEKKIKQEEYDFIERDCPICQSDNFQKLSETDRYGLYLPVVICKECGLIQVNPRMSKKAYNDFYRLEYRKLYKSDGASPEELFNQQKKKGEAIYRFISNQINSELTGAFVLEVGCGAGGIIQAFKEHGCRVCGTDLNGNYLEYGKDKYGLDLREGSVQDISLNEEPNLVIYADVIEHLLTPVEELSYLSSIIKDGGGLFINTPGVKNLTHSYNMKLINFLQNAHTYYFSLRTLVNLLNMSKFELMYGNENINVLAVNRKFTNTKEIEFKSDYRDIVDYLNALTKIKRILENNL